MDGKSLSLLTTNLTEMPDKAGPNFMKSSINQTLTSIQMTYVNGNFMPQDVKSKEEYSGNFHAGFQANFGLEYSLVRNLYLVEN